MSRREAFQNHESIKDVLVPMGMASEKAAGMSGEIVKLSADLGSFNDLPTSQVMLDISSALVGNFETMKKYGVVLNETVVREQARAMGLHKGKGLLDAQVKSEVAYQLIVKGSRAAIGDMERTAEGWANTMKDLGAKWEDFMAGLGNFVIRAPIVKTWLSGMKTILSDIAEILHGPDTKIEIQAQIKHYEELLQKTKETSTFMSSLKQAFGWASRSKDIEAYTGKITELRAALADITADEAKTEAKKKAEAGEKTDETRKVAAAKALKEFEKDFEKTWANISTEAEKEQERRYNFTRDLIGLE